jgi:hypothetical protein
VVPLHIPASVQGVPVTPESPPPDELAPEDAPLEPVPLDPPLDEVPAPLDELAPLDDPPPSSVAPELVPDEPLDPPDEPPSPLLPEELLPPLHPTPMPIAVANNSPAQVFKAFISSSLFRSTYGQWSRKFPGRHRRPGSLR